MKKDEIIRFTACRILRNEQLVEEDLWIRNGVILNPTDVFFAERKKADRVIQCPYIISPGFIDIQINGAAGIDFSTSSENVPECVEGVEKVSKFLLSKGVTAFCPTLVTSSSKFYKQTIPHIKRRKGGKHGAEILGLHLEGPFIDKVKKRGAHNPEFIIDRFEKGWLSMEGIYGSDLTNVSVVTLAPELENSMEVIRRLSELGIRVSLGHSMAGLEVAEQAVQNGASALTHLFCAMATFHHRDDPGLLGIISSSLVPKERKTYFGLITDDVHVHPTAMRIAYRSDPNGVMLISDAMAATGLADGVHMLGTYEVEKKGFVATLLGTQTLAGSVVTIDTCVRKFWSATKCSLAKALNCATLHPAKFLGIENRKGVLEYGADADLVVLDDKAQVLATLVAGEVVYERDDFALTGMKDWVEK